MTDSKTDDLPDFSKPDRLMSSVMSMAQDAVDRVEQLLAELELYREAAQYDALMSGPVFKGWNRSALDRARRMTEARLEQEERAHAAT